jgi:hypothetical protein
MEVFGETAGIYRTFADQAAGESPCFEAWARSVAEDAEVLAWLADLPEPKRQPNLVLAAARWHGVPAPGPYDALRTALLDDDGSVVQTILTRSTQTNEVGRLATLLPAFSLLGDSLSLVEAGASAGLCLYPDRYDYRWTTAEGDRLLGGSGGPLLATDARGPLPVPGRPLEVAWRAGIDLNPLDVTREDDVAWLLTLVWPEQSDRRARLETAVAIARDDPPRIVAGDILDAVPALVAEAPGVPVVFHSAVVVYLERDRRLDFVAMMTDLVARGACHWVSNEAPGVVPGLPVPEPAVPGRFLLAVDGVPVAWTHGHGADVTWLPAAGPAGTSAAPSAFS